MKPRALVYSNSQEFTRVLVDVLTGHGVLTYGSKEAENRSFSYVFVFLKKGETIPPRIPSGGKLVVVAHYEDRGEIKKILSVRKAKIIYYDEILFGSINTESGRGTNLIVQGKSKQSIVLPAKDYPLYPVLVNPLVEVVLRESFSYFFPKEYFVYHKMGAYFLADLIASIDSQVGVSIDKRLGTPLPQKLPSGVEQVELNFTKNDFAHIYNSLTLPAKKDKREFLKKISFWLLVFYVFLVLPIFTFNVALPQALASLTVSWPTVSAREEVNDGTTAILETASGKIVSVNIISHTGGEVLEDTFYEAREIDSLIAGQVEPPAVLAEYADAKTWHFEDLLFSPDPRQNIDRIKWFLEKALGRTVDEVELPGEVSLVVYEDVSIFYPYEFPLGGRGATINQEGELSFLVGDTEVLYSLNLLLENASENIYETYYRVLIDRESRLVSARLGDNLGLSLDRGYAGGHKELGFYLDVPARSSREVRLSWIAPKRAGLYLPKSLLNLTLNSKPVYNTFLSRSDGGRSIFF